MAKEKLEILKDANITNNCPECFNQDMQLTFYQKHIYGKLYHRTTAEVSHQLKCNRCNSVIYPVSWTEDIEKIFDYYQKMVAPEKASIRFTALFFVLILIGIVLVGTAVYLYLEGIISI